MYLSAEAILNVSLAIERKAIEFYNQVRHRIDSELLDQLISEEKEHIRIFESIFDAKFGKLAGQRFKNPYMDDNLLAAAYAETEILGDFDPDEVEESQLFDIAVTIEKNAVLFYSDLIETIGDGCPDEQALLREMREEERRHLKVLVERKKALKQRPLKGA